MNYQVNISFDDESKVRVLEPETFENCNTLTKECGNFVNKIQTFSGTVQSLLEMMEKQAAKIETEKLKAIGIRNRAEGEAERRKQQIRKYNALIAECQGEMDKLVKQQNSLLKVEQEQRLLLEKLGNNEA